MNKQETIKITDDDLNSLIWGLEREGFYARTTAALRELREYRKAPAGSLNEVNNGKQLTITLPDISSKAFWSYTGKHEVFHPETYKRWVQEAIERDCTINGIGVEVK